MLTRYSFGWVIVPVMLFFAVFGGQRRIWHCRGGVSGVCRGRGVAVDCAQPGGERHACLARPATRWSEGTFAFPARVLMQSLESRPDLGLLVNTASTNYLMQNLRIFPGRPAETGRRLDGRPVLGRSAAWPAQPVARRLRYFTLMCLGVFIIFQALGRTRTFRYISPEMNSENLLVLLTPLVMIFGVAFFLTLSEPDETAVPQIARHRHRRCWSCWLARTVHPDPAAAQKFKPALIRLIIRRKSRNSAAGCSRTN